MIKKKRQTEQDEGSWALAYADMVLNMFVFFVILVAVAPEETVKEMRPQIELTSSESLLKEIAPRIQDILGLDLVDHGDEESNSGGGSKEAGPTSSHISVSLNEGDYSRGSSKDLGTGNNLRADTNSQFDGEGELPAGEAGGTKLAEKPGTAGAEEGKNGVDLIRRLPRPLIDSVMDGGDQWETDLSGNEHSIMINFGKDIYAPGDFYVNKRTKLILNRVYTALAPYSSVVRVTVIGHTDSSRIKTPRKNMPDNRFLSFYRAYQATEYLRKLGMPNESLDALAADSAGRDTRSISIKIEKRVGVTIRNKE